MTVEVGRMFACACVLVALLAGCKRDAAPKPPPAGPAVTRVAPSSNASPPLATDAGAAAPRGSQGGQGVLSPPALPPTARFPTLAALRAQPLFAPFVAFVESDDDLDDGETAPAPAAPPAAAPKPDDDADDSDSDSDSDGEADNELSPDRPPTDVQVTRLAFTGEVYDLSYEENCGDGLEDRRNLHHVVIERRGTELAQVFRYALCGDSRRGFNLDVQHLGPNAPELLIRTWRLEPDGGGETILRAFARVNGALVQQGALEEASNTATRFEVEITRGVVDVKVVSAEEEGETIGHRRHVLGAGGFVLVPAGASPGAPIQK